MRVAAFLPHVEGECGKGGCTRRRAHQELAELAQHTQDLRDIHRELLLTRRHRVL